MNLNGLSNYKLIQMFGYKGSQQTVHNDDIISKISFDSTGQYIALGDQAGRIIIFQNCQSNKKTLSTKYYAEFQSHTKQFDPLKSQKVSQTIKDLFWLKGQGKYQKIVTTNQKNIKLWKIFEKSIKKVVKSAGNQYNMPRLHEIQNILQATNQISFPKKHLSPIISINSSPNQQYIISNDNVHAYLWNLDKLDKPYIVADYLKGNQIEDVKERLTCNSYHPISDSLFLIGSNKGTLQMSDLRLGTESAVSFNSEKAQNKNFFTQLVSSYSNVKFIKNGKYIVARDYLTVKLWDIANTSKPLSTISIQQGLKSKLYEIFQNDAFQDKFTLSCSQNGCEILTGNYNNNFHIINPFNGQNCQYELNYKKNSICKIINNMKQSSLGNIDYRKKVITCSFHPKKKIFAVSSLNCFFIYSV